MDQFAYDGTVDEHNGNFTAKYYVSDLNDYIRYNIITKYFNDLYSLYNNQFYLNQMLLSCKYQKQNCSIFDFMYHFDFYYGLCWRFNQGRNLQVIRT